MKLMDKISNLKLKIGNESLYFDVDEFMRAITYDNINKGVKPGETNIILPINLSLKLL